MPTGEHWCVTCIRPGTQPCQFVNPQSPNCRAVSFIMQKGLPKFRSSGPQSSRRRTHDDWDAAARRLQRASLAHGPSRGRRASRCSERLLPANVSADMNCAARLSDPACFVALRRDFKSDRHELWGPCLCAHDARRVDMQSRRCNCIALSRCVLPAMR